MSNVVGACVLLLWSLVASFVVCFLLGKMEDWRILASERMSGGRHVSLAEEAASPGSAPPATAPRAQPTDVETPSVPLMAA